MERIMARSPFFVSAFGTGLQSATAYIWIWKGDYASKPSQKTYSITKTPLKSGEDLVKFEISQIIRDYFEHERDAYTVNSTTFADAIWVEVGISQLDDAGLHPFTYSTYIALDGYGYFEQGANPEYVNADYTMRVPDGADIRIPVQVDADNANVVEYYSATTGLLLFTDSVPETSVCQQRLAYLTRAQPAERVGTILVRNGLSILYTITVINEINECRHHEIKYYDKDGALRIMYAYGRAKKSTNISSNEYRSDITGLTYINYTYDVKSHQKKRYNISAQDSVILNTGFIRDYEQENVRQLLLSEYVWLDDVPVMVSQTGLDYKDNRFDKLIDISLKFTVSNQVINDVY